MVQETVESAVAWFRHYLLEKERAASSWQAQSNQWEARWRDVTEANMKLLAQERELAALVGAETPIAAFTLAETWQAEKQAYMERVGELERKIDHYLAERDISDMMHDVQIQERDEARADLVRCASAHQKALEQVEHYGAALTELALTGNPIANDALGTAPHEDRTRALFRQLEETRAEQSRLLSIIGAETPIAAFTLAETWQAEKAHYMEQVEALTKALDQTYEEWRDARNAEMLCVRGELDEARRVNRKLLEDYSNLQSRLSQSEAEAAALATRVSSHNASASINSDEETQVLRLILSAHPSTKAGQTLPQALQTVLDEHKRLVSLAQAVCQSMMGYTSAVLLVDAEALRALEDGVK